MALRPTKARFFEPMLLLATNAFPEGADWEYELLCAGPHTVRTVIHFLQAAKGWKGTTSAQ